MKKEEILEVYQKYKLFIFPAIVALSSLILIVFVIYPQIIKMATNQKAQGEMLQRVKVLEVKAQELESYDLEDLKKKLGFALISYPTDKDFVSGLGYLQNIISEAGFDVVSMTIGGNISQTENKQSYSIRVEVSGPRALLPSLLNKIESSPRIMRIASLETAGGRVAQLSNTSINLSLLYSPTPEGTPSVEVPLPKLSEEEEGVAQRLAEVISTASITDETIPIEITPALGPRGRENPFE